MLVAGLAKLSRVEGLRSIMVETQPSNLQGLDFCLAMGFRLCGYNDRYHINDPKTAKDVAVFLSLDLQT
jgi:hypothetical protein